MIDGQLDQVVKTIAVGRSPFNVAVNSKTNLVYVTNQGDKTVSVIDPKTNSIKETIRIDGVPYYIAVNDITNTVYVTTHAYGYVTRPPGQNAIYVINGSNALVEDTIPIIFDGKRIAPLYLAVNPHTNTIYFTATLFGSEVPSLFLLNKYHIFDNIVLGSFSILRALLLIRLQICFMLLTMILL